MEIKLLIVDDEVQIRAGIEKGIPWKKFGISKVHSAPNGVRALEIMEAEKINILITDIRMPGIDGLELARKAKEKQEDIHIIIVSGFSEFDYAKQAINIGVKDYLLKPIKVKELTDNVNVIVEAIQEEEKIKTRNDLHLTEEKLIQYLQTKDLYNEELLQLLEVFAGLTTGDKIVCVLIEPDTALRKEKGKICDDMRQIFAEEAKANEHDFVLSLPGYLLYGIRMDLSRSRWQVVKRIEEIMQGANADLEAEKLPTATAAVSDNCPASKLADAVDECIHLLKKRLYMGNGKVIPYEEQSGGENRSFYMQDEEQIRKYIISFQYEEVEKYIIQNFNNMKEEKISSYDLVKGVCLTLKQFLFRCIRETGLEVEQVLEKNKDFLLEVPELYTIEQYRDWICSLYYLILKGVSQHSKKNVSQVVMTAVVFISTHYHEDLTVDQISAYVSKSKNYFSYLFKKEMEVSFTEYLNKYRVEQACILLETTLDLTGEIGQKVGYKDERYFSSVFKKIVGISPLQYRKTRGIEEKK